MSEILPRQMNESQARVNQGQETESNLQRRTARQKRVQTIVQILGFPSSGLGIGLRFIL